MPSIEIFPLRMAEVGVPDWHPRAGETVPVYAFALLHADGVILFDTGIGPPHPLIDKLYRARRFDLATQLAGAGSLIHDVTTIINCHLHFDHCGWNSLFPETPIFVQAAELEATHEKDYTIREFIDFPGARYQVIDGQAEVVDGVRVVPTPGHTRGHQSVAVETDRGLVILAGQAAETAEEFGRIEADGSDGVASLRHLHNLAPAHVYFSHDQAVWEQSTQE